MKLTKKLEAEVLKAYHTIWDAYLRGDMRTFVSILDENCYIIGSAAAEVFSNKKEAVKYYKATAKQITGKAEFRNRKINVMPADKGFMVNEESDFFLLIDDQWTFYGPARISSLFHKKNNKWKVIHQHGSFPDSKTEEGEQVNTEKIKAENIQLRDAIKRRTIELENKNRELEIEAAVEKVRVRALAMHKSQEIIEVVKTLRNELLELDLDGITAVTICLKQDDGRIRLWDITDLENTGRYSWDVTFDINKIDPRLWVSQIWRSRKKIIACEQDSTDLKRTLKWLSQYDKKTADEITELIKVNNIKRGWHRAVKLANGRLITDFINEPSGEIESILLKMGAAFDLAYKRFLDLRKAEAQVREGEIQLALERVRAKATAMHKSEEIQGIVEEVFLRLKELGVGLDTANILIFNKGSDVIESWTASTNTSDYRTRFLIPISSARHFSSVIAAMEKGKELVAGSYEYKEKNKWFSYLFTHTDYKYIPEERKQFILDSPLFTVSVGISGNIGIQLNSYSRKAFNDEENNILIRFTKVFEQAYTRFLDLQKAEAQAREAQIELALERVRARAMAMQNSNELAELVSTVFKELTKLDFALTSCIIWIHDHELSSDTLWIASSEMNKPPEPYQVKPFYNDFFKSITHAWKAKDPKWAYSLTGPEKKNFEKAFFKELPNLPDALRKALKVPKQVVFSASFNNFGGLEIVETEALTGEKFEILHRFGKVFDSSYTRFNDLKKAEAQSREAQIELGLERVRSRAMAMQTSEELNELIGTVFTELTKLDLVLTRCVIWVFEPLTSAARWWMANSEEPSAPVNFFIKYHEHSAYVTFVQEWKKQNVKFVYDLNGQNKISWDDILFNETELANLPEVVKNGMRAPERVLLSASFNNFGGINVASLEPLSEEHFDILLRFAKVFDLTYTRFNDLKQAEAQAREAQIQLALERVRARTMAMQKSDELPEAANLLFLQVQSLGMPTWSAGYCIWDDDKKAITLSMSSEGVLQPSLKMPVTEDPSLKHFLEAYERGESFFVEEVGGKALKSHYAYLRTLPGVKETLDDIEAAGFPVPTFQIFHLAYFSKGFLLFITYERVPEAHDIFKRFGKVFDQTYTRFLDLQNAEALTREAQIELALERVRARTMAMQKSDELAEAAQLLYEEFRTLNINTFLCGYCFYKEEQNKQTVWVTTPDGTLIPDFTDFPLGGDDVLNKRYEDWKQKKPLHVLEIRDEVNKDHHRFLAAEVPRQIAQEIFSQIPDRIIFYCANFSAGYLLIIATEFLTKQEEEVIIRFAKVFELSYTRFNDLKQAEAQAREAKIEAALERVRSRAMAMHKTDELLDAAELVSEELSALGIESMNVSYAFVDEEEKYASYYTGKMAPFPFVFPHTETEVMRSILTSWKKQEPFNVISLDEEATLKHQTWVGGHIQELFTKNNTDVPFSIEAFLAASPKKAVIYSFNFSKGYLFKIGGERLTKAQEEMALRFTKVFDLTYRRFLDLKQAEAQAREAQIELALERVRARTMAMHKSDELAETAQVLFQQLSELGGIPDRIAIGITDEANGVVNFWTTDQQGGQIDHGFKASLNERTTIAKTYNAWKEQQKSLVIDLRGEELLEWIRFAREEMGIVVRDDQIKDRRVHTMAFFSQGWILITSHEPQSPDTIQILERFASVFNLTYRRFLDLQKAEAQAHEARIEIALERIRARALAMHKSDELMEVAKVLWEQMALLGQPELEASVVHLYEKDPDYIHSWRAVSIGTDSNTQLTYGHMAIPKNSCEVVREWLTNFYSDKKEYTIEISGAKQEEWYDLLFKLAPEVINSMRDKKSIHEKRYYRFSKFSGGALLMVSKQEPSAEVTYLQGRASVVFDLAYRRFSDLQKAEAQAREAQIEAALERVRSSSLAMHKSDELKDVVKVVFENFRSLGLQNIDSVNINIFHPGSKDFDLWLAAPGQDYTTNFHLPYFDHPIVNDFFDAVDNGQTVHKGIYGYDEKNKYFEYMFENSDNKYLPEERKKLILNGPGYSVITAIAKHSSIFIHNYRGETFSEEVNSILQRFTRVFDQTYTRFLDLQRAEAQAREAKIETALEKVRSRSLAMHKSDELQEVVNTVFERLKDLDIEMDSANIAIFKEGPRDYDYWIASPFQKRTASFHMPYIDLSLTRDLVAARENGKDFSSAAYSFKEKNEWFDYAFKNTDFKFLTEERKQFILAAPAITVAIAFSKHTGVQVNRYSDKLLSEGEAEILKRFSKVFEQAYIRFLDLEKAEAQARDAQIETALERVRARTMGMHQSKELHDVIETVTNQLLALGLKFDNSVFCRVNEDESWEMWMSTPQQSYPFNIYVPYIDHRIFNNLKEVKAKKFEFYTDVFDRDEAQVFFKHFFENTNAKNVPEERKQYVLSSNGMARSLFLTKDIWFVISRYSPDPFSDEENGILKRFAKVFEQSYIRFLDLEKAEAQAREAQIEASLERVRSKTMAMHNSQDVGQTVATMFDELVKLGIETMRCGIGIMLDEYQMELWTAKPDDTGKVELIIGHLDMKLHPLLTGGYDSWKDKKDGFSYELKDDDLIAYFNVINNYSGYAANYDAASLPSQIFHEEFHFNEGTLFAFSLKRLSAESSQIFKRFSGVFGQTYRRYLDLQKAEANAREAQIEASLERVRSKAMAMHNSADLSSTVNSFFKELKNLGITPMRCGVGEMHDETKTSDLVFTSADKQGELYELPGKLKHEGHPVVENIYEHWKKQEEYHPILQGADISAYYKVIKSQMQLPDFPEYAKHYGNYFYFREGFFFAWGDEQFTEEGLNICRRFTSVLSLTYKRYKDLKQAEANAREAQIEAGLERVRARTMAMHSSDDVSAATATMFTELERLGIESFRGGILNIRPDQTMDVWSVNNLAEGKVVKAAGEFDMTMHPFWQQLYTGWVNKHEVLYFNMSGKVKEDYIRILDARRDYLPGGMQELPDSHIQSYYFGEGFVWTFTLQPHSEEDKQVMKKFASVFSLTFRRYQDLKKAEAQAREATIEAALEKVRGKAMAMHNSNDLTATASQVFTELRKLGISPLRCGVGILNKENRKALLYSAVASEEGDNLSQFGWVLLDENPVLKSIYDHWIGSEDYFPVLTKEMLKAYYTHLKVGFEVPDEHKEYEQYGYFIAFSEGMFYGWAERPFTASEIKILKRFASVIDLTFRRYMELQKSEANAREAVKQAALDRVRAEIASMRTVNDLERITPLIWNELTILGIPFIRCGVFIMDEAQQLIHTFLSTPDGKAIAAFHLPYDTPGNLRNVISNWKQKQRYIDHWDETAFIQFADILVKQGALNSAELYLKTIPRGGFHLHFLPFLQGMLYVGNTTQLHDDEIVLIQHVADAFSTAYARYEDFNKLEAAKEQVEKTLTDLKQAQTQLVQSEKMASLGELTAGIAHEIQNPLNFVNNFSDVSNELLEEMKTELEKGNADDAMAIVEDIKQNLEKILHHGKRADAIVKGMLQHSRISSGQKEPTDINMLADEYLRLAFHGLRAKDKSFNAKFETEFDNSIGKINIIPQDIGRVILNLINNAFYAVTEKKKTPQLPKGGAPYEPVVTVTTKKDNGKIEITVKDNGNGIPQKVLDKIFQPFFTTKPTGQGTGLGLSLSYDIITKGHGGELKVETKEGEGSEFVIQLPTN